MTIVAVYVALFSSQDNLQSQRLLSLYLGNISWRNNGKHYQYLIASSAPEAPDFANGLFISSCNVGTTIGFWHRWVIYIRDGHTIRSISRISHWYSKALTILVRKLCLLLSKQLSK